jgi:hypothetical protein
MQSDGICFGAKPAETLEIGLHALIAMQKPIGRFAESRSSSGIFA